MTSAPWSLHLLGEVLSAFSLDRPYPLRDVVSRVAEGVDAEITAILRDGSFNVCTGLTEQQRPALLTLAQDRSKILTVGSNHFHLFWAQLGEKDLLVVGRAEQPYNLEERALLLGMSRCVQLSCQILEAVQATRAAEEAVRLEKAALMAEKRAKEEAIRDATIDHLTGLANRRLILHHLDELLRTEHTVKGKVAVMFIDLDRFKQINDTHGHQAGDLVLRITADQLKAVARETDLVGRLAGDEFLMIAILRSAADAERMASRILKRMKDNLSIDGISISSAASIGIALAEPGDCIERVLENADAAMYAAKQQGRGRFAVYHEQLRQIQADTSHPAVSP